MQSHDLVSRWFASDGLNHHVNQIRLLGWIVVIVEYLTFKFVSLKYNGQWFRIKCVNGSLVPCVGVHIPSHLEYFHKLTLINLFRIFSLFDLFFFSLYLVLSRNFPQYNVKEHWL